MEEVAAALAGRRQGARAGGTCSSAAMERITDDLEALERRLYDFAVSEGYTE